MKTTWNQENPPSQPLLWPWQINVLEHMKEENIAEQYFFPPSSVPAKALEVKHLLIFKTIEFNYPD